MKTVKDVNLSHDLTGIYDYESTEYKDEFRALVEHAEQIKKGTIDFLVENDVTLSYVPGLTRRTDALGVSACQQVSWRKVKYKLGRTEAQKKKQPEVGTIIKIEGKLANKSGGSLGHPRTIKLKPEHRLDFDAHVLLHEIAHCKETIALEKKFGDTELNNSHYTCGERVDIDEYGDYMYVSCVPKKYPFSTTTSSWEHREGKIIPHGSEISAEHYVQRLPVGRYGWSTQVKR